ncbi:MAG: hypothetical protein CMH26_04015 [Micavibrio sp.]|nr:hypothetical protein [Micavibrio sp.]|tara:strand:+ start:1544 stop:1819 length:276 start_codon:yes stop_codon:yes gene_type:complete
MRFLMILMIAAGTFAQTSFAAEDNFGAPFANNSPSAFEDPVEGHGANALAMDEAAMILQDIMPAAGEDDPEPLALEGLQASPEDEVIEESE